MGPAPSLATYEAQAKAQYAPQQQAESTTLAASHQANLNTLNTQKSTINPLYDSQEASLKSTVEQNAASISSTYSAHLLGNFSGLQGNDMGMMFSKALTQENGIETARTNALNAINTSITNEGLSYDANQTALVSKYQGLEAGAASSAYNAAEKSYETQQLTQAKMAQMQANSDRTYNLAVAKFSRGPAQKQPTAADTKNNVAQQIAASLSKVTGNRGGTQRGDNYVSPQSYNQAKNAWVQAGYSAAEFDGQFSNFRNPKNKNYGVSQSASQYLANAPTY